MIRIFEIFKELKAQSPNTGDGFSIASLPRIKSHKIGVSLVGQPMFFIKCGDTVRRKFLDCNLEFISVQYSRQCQLIDKKNKVEEGIYTIISLKTSSEDLQEYFLKIVFLLVNNLSELPKLKDLKIEIEKLINLFNRFSKPPTNTIQGLWSELLVIEQSKNPDYLIQSWHSSILDKFDFNDGRDKIEVKSTSQNRRIHSFSLEQLIPNVNSNLIITSVNVVETGIGTSIFELIRKIEHKIRDKKLSFRINEIVSETLGKDLEKSFDIFYDYQLAVDSIQFYNGIDIPTINVNDVPPNIMHVRFDCDLTDVKTASIKKSKSNLHNSLF